MNRNDLCSCGSGKKYKKCCMIKEREAKEKEIAEFQEWFQKDIQKGKELLKNVLTCPEK